MNLYLAGKIDKLGWRHSIVAGLADIEFPCDGSGRYPILENSVIPRFSFCGPYFMPEREYSADYSNESSAAECCVCHEDSLMHGMRAIEIAHLMFCWLDLDGAYQTMEEIEYAMSIRHQNNLKIMIATPLPSRFPQTLPFCKAADKYLIEINPIKAFVDAVVGLGYARRANELPITEFDSPIEEMFYLAWARWHRPEELEYQKHIGPYRVDFLHTESRTVIECDGFEWHSDRDRFTADRERDRALAAQGYLVVRFSGRELNDNAHAKAAEAYNLCLQRMGEKAVAP